MKQSTKILLLIIIAVAIILVYLMKYKPGLIDEYINSENISPIQQQLHPGPQLYWYGPGQGTYDNINAPLMYGTQMYPKVPWYPKTGQICTGPECGATSSCVNGVCVPNKTNKTVFDVEIN